MNNINKIKPGDIIKCVLGGGNNTSCGDFETVGVGSSQYKIVKILTGGKFNGFDSDMNTIKTECGRYLWNSLRYYEVVGSFSVEPNYEIY